MYAYIKGTIAEKGTDYVISDVSGVGYMICCSSKTLNKVTLGSEAKLYTYFHVADDANTLYGFYTQDERDMFKKLISVSRIGRKIALGTLSVLTPADITLAVATDNVAAFDDVTGMGRKTAQRVILELKEKVNISASARDTEGESKKTDRAAAIEALVALGYDGLSAGRAVGEIQDSQFDTVEDLIRKSLAVISGRK